MEPTDMASTSNSTAPPTLLGYSANTEEFLNQLTISIPLGVVIVIIYCILRVRYPLTFELRRKLSQNLLNESTTNEEEDDEDYDVEQREHNLNQRRVITFPSLSDGYVWWMYDVWTMDNNTFYKHAGFDALVFRLYLKGCCYICLASLPYALFVLLPVYGTSEVMMCFCFRMNP